MKAMTSPKSGMRSPLRGKVKKKNLNKSKKIISAIDTTPKNEVFYPWFW
jgi:hypothetical protein